MRDQVARLRSAVDETVDRLGITPDTVHRVVATALDLARQQPLRPHLDERQLADSTRRCCLGVAADRIYLDRAYSGTTRARPGLDQALAAVRPGDTLVERRI